MSWKSFFEVDKSSLKKPIKNSNIIRNGENIYSRIDSKEFTSDARINLPHIYCLTMEFLEMKSRKT